MVPYRRPVFMCGIHHPSMQIAIIAQKVLLRVMLLVTPPGVDDERVGVEIRFRSGRWLLLVVA